ncbi:MAG TPA: hypothetical protein VEF76_11090 [Patescibacteria group bacterium]|nr:hypothetical protein [Patescibacteria group bacterium]
MAKRRLTAGETALAKTVFGDSVDYARVWLHDRRILPFGFQRREQAVAKANHISFPRSAYAEDFSKETDAQKQSVFIHEMTHVWQHQNKVVHTPLAAFKETLRHKFNYQKCYLHRLDPAKDLLGYGFEQQAAIVQDYFLLTRHSVTASFKNRRLECPEDLLAKYERVLNQFLKDPGYAGKARKPPPRKPAP